MTEWVLGYYGIKVIFYRGSIAAGIMP